MLLLRMSNTNGAKLASINPELAMRIAMDISTLIDWIENHKTTVDLLKWIGLLVAAWAAGLFGYLRGLARKPRAEIITKASRCLVEDIDEFNGKLNARRVAFLLDVNVANPTNEKVIIEQFLLSYWADRFWSPRSQELYKLSLPARPRQEMGSGIKFSKVFWTKFDDGHDDLTMNGVLNPKDFQNAYMLFVSFTYGSWNPKITNDRIKVRLTIKVTAGNILKSVAYIPIARDKEQFEKWVPGIINQVAHHGAWNAFAD